MRFGAYFVGLCIAIIAASIGAAAYLSFDLSGVEAGAVALTALSVLSAYHAFAGRARDRADLSHQLAELSRGTTGLARQVGDLGRRVFALEAAVAQNPDKLRAATAPLASEIEVLGTLVKQVAESVAAHEIALLERPAATAATPAAPAHQAAAALLAAAPDEPRELAPAAASPDRLPAIRAAIEANRLDLYLQPIVTLPQRKVRFYEALTRLRSEDGTLLLPAEFLAATAAAGLMPRLDNLMAFRAVQVVRRLTAKNRETGVFCNVASATLADATSFTQLLEFFTANRALAPGLIFELSQAAVRMLGPIEQESLAQLASLGFRFSMDQVDDLQLEPRALAEQGFRYVKVPGTLLLNRSLAAAGDIHPSDLANLLARYGIELIADKIESESTVVDLLDYDVRLAQGLLFAPPKPVRNEALQGAAAPAPPQHASAPMPARPLPNTAEPAAPPAPGLSPERITANLMQLARNMARRA